MKKEILRLLSPEIRRIIYGSEADYTDLTEIRLRTERALQLSFSYGDFFLDDRGAFTDRADRGYIVRTEDMRFTMESISEYSLYAYEEELRQGYITVAGGHRIGLAGQVIMDNGRIKNVKNISFMNIRLAHQIKGCSHEVMPYIIREGRVLHTLIISPPACGKTTLLRDIVRNISNGGNTYTGMNVGVVDERSEIAACYMGVPQNDVGSRTDVLDACPKAEGMLMLLRSMNPRVIAVDEIGSREDIDAISYVINCGCGIVATVHGASIDDVRTKPVLRKLVEERVFDRYVVLGRSCGIGTVENIFDERGNDLFFHSYSVAN